MDIPSLKKSLIRHEGWKQKPYLDTKGKTTIGVGRNLSDVGLSPEEVDYLLANDIDRALKDAQSQPWWHTVSGSANRSNAMVELVFNMGLPKLLTFKKALAALEAGDFATAVVEFRNSLWAKQVSEDRVNDLMAQIEHG